MPLGRVIIALVLVAMFMVVGVSAIDEAYTDSGQTQEILDESVNTGAEGTIQKLDQSDIDGVFYDQTAVIENSSNVIMVGSGEDYTWFEKNGTFRIDSARLADETGVTVDYSYTVPNQNQTMVANLYGDFYDGLAPIVLMFLVVAAIIGAAGRLGAA